VKHRGGSAWLLAGVLALGAPLALAEGFDNANELTPFIERVESRHGLGRERLAAILGEARFLPNVIEAMTRPAEGLPWHRYRRIFLTPARIDAGVAFRRHHAADLARAEARFGVPAAVIVAIIGVETMYGERAGNIRVLDALATLGFRFQRRAEFFQRELEEFLLLVDQEGLDHRRILGSYAGAMGIPQFIPSSYRHYAIDFDGDGVRDLLGSPADAIGSVGNYLQRHGWQTGGIVAAPARVDSGRAGALLESGYKPHVSVSDLGGVGVSYEARLDPSVSAALIALDGKDGEEYWVVLNNFYVITRYNRSKLYAMAVHQLAGMIHARTEAER
jgi:membrane-bound lytic murein transglycosylase B